MTPALLFKEAKNPENQVIFDISRGNYQKDASAFLGTPSELKKEICDMFSKSGISFVSHDSGNYTFSPGHGFTSDASAFIVNQLTLKLGNEPWDEAAVTNTFFNCRYGKNMNPDTDTVHK